MPHSRPEVAPEATNLRLFTCELSLRQYLKLREVQRRLSAEFDRDVDLEETIAIVLERLLARYDGAGAAESRGGGVSMSRVSPRRLVGGAPNVRQASGASFSSA